MESGPVVGQLHFRRWRGETTYTYNYGPNQQTASLSSPSTQWSRTTYDGFGRTIKTETGHDSTTVTSVDTQYAACGATPSGKTSQVSQPYGPGETELWTTYTYDGSCRLTKTTKPDSSATTNLYSGNTVKTTDPAGHWKTYTNDAMGNLLSVTEPDPNSSGTLPTYYTYNGANQLTQVQMTRSGVMQTRSFAWTGSDLASSTNPENGTVTYTYDGNHHLLTRTDAKNQQTQYTYDGYERLTEVVHLAYCTVTCPGYSEIYNQHVNYFYDTGYGTNLAGRLSIVTFNLQTPGGSGSGPYINYYYSYNTAGRLIGQQMQRYNAPNAWVLGLTASYGWDNQGRLTSMTYPSGTQLTYNYDAISRLTSISETQGSSTWTAATATYNSANLMTGLTYGPYGPQFSETRTYNNLLQLIRDTVTGGSSTLMDMQYVFPSGANNGKVSQTTDGVLGETVSYQYDSLNRLIAATASNNSWGEAYSFDGFGNLQSKTPTVGSAPTSGGATPATNQPSGVSLDANGNTLGNGSTPYVWDVENHLISSSTTTSPTYFYYDPWGKRVWNETFTSGGASSGGEFYFYGIGGQKLETYSFNSSYGYSLEGINVYFGAGGKLLQSKGVWVATDRQGTVRANSNSESFSYFPYGEERTSTANGREKFGSYTRDANGQDYAGARYYNSNGGAFWSPDPGGIRTANPMNPFSWNRYMFVLGDPVNLNDPTGQVACDPDVDDGCFADAPDCTNDTSCADQGNNAGSGSWGIVQTDGTVAVPDPTKITVASTAIEVQTITSELTTTIVTTTETVVSTSIVTAILAPIVSTIVTVGGLILGTTTATSGCDTLTCQYGTNDIPSVVSSPVGSKPSGSREGPSEKLLRCTDKYLAELKACEENYPPGPGRQACYASAKSNFNNCMGYGIQ